MLGKLARQLPEGNYLFEPKWDGFRCLVFRDGDEIDLRSRNGRRLGRYFPELVEALRRLASEHYVVDGEIVLVRDGGFDFPALMSRLHPAATRVERLAREMPAAFVAFDLLAEGDNALTQTGFASRRRQLERLLRDAELPIHLTPSSSDRRVAIEWLDRYQGTGIDGVMAKPRDLLYEPGTRAMIKVKPERTADCVVAGFRWFVDRPLPSSLLLGLYDQTETFQHIGVVTSFSSR